MPVTIFVRKFRGLGHAVGSRFIRSFIRLDFSRNFSPSAYRRTTTVRASRFPFSIYFYRKVSPRREIGGEASRVIKGAVSRERAGAPRDRERVAQRDDAIGRNNDALERRTRTECAACAAFSFCIFLANYEITRRERDRSFECRASFVVVPLA